MNIKFLKKITTFLFFTVGLVNLNSVQSASQNAESIEAVLTGKFSSKKEKPEIVDVIKAMLTENCEQIYSHLKKTGQENKKALDEATNFVFKNNKSRINNGVLFCFKEIPFMGSLPKFNIYLTEAKSQTVSAILANNDSLNDKKLKIEILDNIKDMMPCLFLNVAREKILKSIGCLVCVLLPISIFCFYKSLNE